MWRGRFGIIQSEHEYFYSVVDKRSRQFDDKMRGNDRFDQSLYLHRVAHFQNQSTERNIEGRSGLQAAIFAG